jgi:hypothetical protein
LPHDYAWRWYPHHLARAGRIDELRRLLTSPGWLATRLERHGLGALIGDYDYLGERDPVRLVQAALIMDGHPLFLNRSQLPTQVLGRLGRGIDPAIDRLIEATPGATQGPWLRPVRASLHPAGGALVRVMRGYAGGHQGTVRSIAIDPDCRFAITAGNSTQDQAVSVWNLWSGSHRVLPDQARAGYTPLAISSDGTCAVIASGSDVRLVETADAKEIRSWSGEGVVVTAIALSGDAETRHVGNLRRGHLELEVQGCSTTPPRPARKKRGCGGHESRRAYGRLCDRRRGQALGCRAGQRARERRRRRIRA